VGGKVKRGTASVLAPSGWSGRDQITKVAQTPSPH